MARRIVIPESAQEDLKAIRQRVKQAFGAAAWNTVNAEFKRAMKRIGRAPAAGKPIEELEALGMHHVKSTLVRQTRIVDEVDEALVIVHLFILGRRDFRAHLLQRMLRR